MTKQGGDGMSERITAEEAQRLLDDAAYDCDPGALFPWKWRAWVGADGDGGRIGSVRVAFHSYHGWWQLAVVKSAIVLAATPAAARVRRCCT